MNEMKAFDRTVRKIFTQEVNIGAMRYIISFFGVLLIGSVLIAAQGEDPVTAAMYILKGAFGDLRNFGDINNMREIGNTLRWATPCMLTGAAAIVAFKSGVVNLGIEGQMYLGAFVSAILGWLVQLPAPWHVIVCLLCAGISGVIWVVVPALMRLFLRIDEYVTTMMMNFIATLFCDYFVVWVIIPKLGIITTTAATPNISSTARLGTIIPGTTAGYGFIIAVMVCIFVFVFYKFTIKGYELKQVGENLTFAKTGGVNVKKTFISIFLISGFLGGLSGGVEVTGGLYHYVSGFSYTMGWEGIMIANICNRNPIALIFVSIVWGALKAGAMNMERNTSLNRLTVNILQMIFVILVSIDYEGIVEAVKNSRKKKREHREWLAKQEGK